MGWKRRATQRGVVPLLADGWRWTGKLGALGLACTVAICQGGSNRSPLSWLEAFKLAQVQRRHAFRGWKGWQFAIDRTAADGYIQADISTDFEFLRGDLAGS